MLLVNNGLIIQYGGTGGVTDVLLPISYTSTNYSVVCTVTDNAYHGYVACTEVIDETKFAKITYDSRFGARFITMGY